jgi:hypothetical protein
VEIHGCIVVVADMCALCDVLFREDAADLITLIDLMGKVPSTKEVGKLFEESLGGSFLSRFALARSLTNTDGLRLSGGTCRLILRLLLLIIVLANNAPLRSGNAVAWRCALWSRTQQHRGEGLRSRPSQGIILCCLGRMEGRLLLS